MPIHVACVYECDGCRKQVSGNTATKPEGWNNGGRLALNVAKAARVLVTAWGRTDGVTPYVFCSQACSDAHEEKLTKLGHR
jgi:hypothetical protein